MLLRVWYLITLLLVALTLGLAFCHVMQMPAKLDYNAELYAAVNNTLYRSFDSVGAILEAGAVFSSAVLVVLLKRRKPASIWALAGAAFTALSLLTWFVLIAPVNQANFEAFATGGLNASAATWMRLRVRWEYAHVVRAVFLLFAMSALLVSLLSQLRGAERRASPASASREAPPLRPVETSGARG